MVGETNVWRTLTYTKRVNGIHSATFQLESAHPFASLYELDGQMEIWRRVPEYNIDWYVDFEGMMRTPVDQLFSNARETFTIYAYGYCELLSRRTVRYFSGTQYSEKTNLPIETAMKQFVYENAGAGAVSPPRITDGVMQGFTVDIDQARGANWSGARAFRNLQSVLEEMAQDGGVFYDVVGNGPAGFLFRYYEGQRGRDLSTRGLDQTTGLNAAGNIPAVFSADFGNMSELAHSVNRSDEVTSVLALGQGVGLDRSNQEARNAVAIADSPWNLREMDYNANQEQSNDGLLSAANAQLQQNSMQVIFSFVPLSAGATILGRDYDWGDIVTARFQGVDYHQSIITKSVSVNDAGEGISLEINSVV